MLTQIGKHVVSINSNEVYREAYFNYVATARSYEENSHNKVRKDWVNNRSRQLRWILEEQQKRSQSDIIKGAR